MVTEEEAFGFVSTFLLKDMESLFNIYIVLFFLVVDGNFDSCFLKVQRLFTIMEQAVKKSLTVLVNCSLVQI